MREERVGKTVHLGRVAHVTRDPVLFGSKALEIFEQGAIEVSHEGLVVRCGPRKDVLHEFPEAQVVNHGQAWLWPGLVDGHVHFPQVFATACPGDGLLDWLQRFIYPAETSLARTEEARSAAHQFVSSLLACGTTTAMVFASQFDAANRALFKEGLSRGLRVMAGVTWMDTQCPRDLVTHLDAMEEQMRFWVTWCGKRDRCEYVITPRFALSCSDDMLALCGELARVYPQCMIQTHINESILEIQAVAERFGTGKTYTDVYDRFGLLTPRTVLAHSIHTTDAELRVFAERGVKVCHCPGSNLFLGSGIFPMTRHLERGVPVMLGTDVGAGTSFSVLHEISLAARLQKLHGTQLGAAEMLYLGTRAGAVGLGLEDRCGCFLPGMDADFVVVHPRESPYLKARLDRCQSPEEALYVSLMLHEPSHIQKTYSQGRLVHERDAVPAT